MNQFQGQINANNSQKQPIINTGINQRSDKFNLLGPMGFCINPEARFPFHSRFGLLSE